MFKGAPQNKSGILIVAERLSLSVYEAVKQVGSWGGVEQSADLVAGSQLIHWRRNHRRIAALLPHLYPLFPFIRPFLHFLYIL